MTSTFVKDVVAAGTPIPNQMEIDSELDSNADHTMQEAADAQVEVNWVMVAAWEKTQGQGCEGSVGRMSEGKVVVCQGESQMGVSGGSRNQVGEGGIES